LTAVVGRASVWPAGSLANYLLHKQ